MHIASNLAQNIKSVLTNYNIRDIHGWTDSTVVLHWLKGKGDYKQFVSNRINMAATTGTMASTTKHHSSDESEKEAKEIKAL